MVASVVARTLVGARVGRRSSEWALMRSSAKERGGQGDPHRGLHTLEEAATRAHDDVAAPPELDGDGGSL
jgi:hypothetical protein